MAVRGRRGVLSSVGGGGAAGDRGNETAMPMGAMLGQIDRVQLASPPVDIVAFKRSFGAAIDRVAADARLAEPTPCAQETWAAAAAACKLDDVVTDINRHFSGPVFAMVIAKRRAEQSPPARKRRRRTGEDGDGSAETGRDAGASSAAGGGSGQADPLESPSEKAAAAASMVAARFERSSLKVLRNVMAIADLADRTKPRKQFNYLPLSSQKRSQAGAFEEDDLVTLDLAGEPPAAADGPADRKALRVPITWPEAVISVALYHPQRPTMKMREFLVLGSQTLAELRDKLPCITDKVLDGPMRHSGYFFIDNVFYNDLRKPENLDYSLPIREWAADPERLRTNPHLAGLRAASMAETRWEDLRLRTNIPYTYCHQGDCEHTLIVRSIRMLHPTDDQDRSAYPRLVFQARLRRPKCRICDLLPAKFVTYGDRLAAENPAFFCEQCYDVFHYDSNGQILYDDFTVFDYEPV